jgi:hypothetical protein
MPHADFRHVLLQHNLVAGDAGRVQPQCENEGKCNEIRFAETAETGFVPSSFVAVNSKSQPTRKKNMRNQRLGSQSLVQHSPTCTEDFRRQHLEPA